MKHVERLAGTCYSRRFSPTLQGAPRKPRRGFWEPSQWLGGNTKSMVAPEIDTYDIFRDHFATRGRLGEYI